MTKFSRKQSISVFALILFLASVSFNILFYSDHLDNPLTWDEVDYASAAQSGIMTNALENQSLSVIQLTELGLAKVRKTPADITSFPSEFSDPFHLRHFHPPLPVYYWNLFLRNDLTTQDFLLRISNIILAVICTFVLLFFIAKIFSGSNKQTVIVAACCSIPFFITSNLFRTSFLQLNFHIFFLPVAIWFIHCLMNFIAISSRRNAIALGLASALVICTLETSVFLFSGALLAVLLLKQKKIFSGNTKIILAAFLLTSLIIWPGIVKTLGPVKSWAMYAYRIFAMHNASYEGVSLSSNLFNLFRGNYLLFLIMFTGYVKLFFSLSSDKKTNRIILIPAIAGLFYGIVMLPFTLSDTYILPAIGLLFIGSVPGVIKLLESSDKAKYILITLSFIYVASIFWKTDFASIKNNAKKQSGNFRDDLSEVKNLLDEKKPILADGGRIFRYYLPDKSEHIIELFRINTKTSEFAIRKNYEYFTQDSLIENRYYKGILIGKSRNYTTAQFEKLKHCGYTFKELNNYYLFYTPD